MFRKVVDTQSLWSEYVHGKQTLKQLSERYGLSHDTITRRFDTIRPPRMVSSSKSVVLLIDTTYWGWRFGVVAFKDARTGKVLWRKFIRQKETLADDVEREDKIESAKEEDLRRIVDMVFPKMRVINEYLDGFYGKTMPDEAILIGNLAQLVDEINLKYD